MVHSKTSAEDVNANPRKGSGLNVNLLFTTFVVAFGSSFLFGYNIGVLNQPKEFIVDFYNETYRNRTEREPSDATLTVLWSLTTALFLPGGMLGSFLGGYLADILGRKKTILVSHVFAIAGAVLGCLCKVATSPELLMLGRFLLGINSGMANCIAPMVLSEIAPYKYRGAFGTVHQLSVTIGIFLSSVLGMPALLGKENLWFCLILIEAIPAIFSLVIMPFLPDTPRFLMLVLKDGTAALQALKFYRRSNNVADEIEEMNAEGRTPLNEESQQPEKSYTILQLVKEAELRRPLFIACFLVIAQQFSGINAIFFYSKSIFENAQINERYIPFAVIGTNAVNVIMTLIAVPLMDIAGRRLLLIVPMAVMIVDFCVLTACLILQINYPLLYAIGYVSVVCVIVYVICFAVGLGPIPLFIGSELFRQGPRPKAMAVVGATMWLATFVIAMVFEPLQKWAKQYTFVVFIALLVGFTVFIYFKVPETKNKTFEEIARQFSSKPAHKVSYSTPPPYTDESELRDLQKASLVSS